MRGSDASEAHRAAATHHRLRSHCGLRRLLERGGYTHVLLQAGTNDLKLASAPEIIERLQQGSQEVVRVINQVSDRIAESTSEFRKADEHFEQINQLLSQLQERALAIASVAEAEGRNATRVSTSVDEIARSSEEAAEAIEHSDRGSKAIGELLTTLKAKTSQFRV